MGATGLIPCGLRHVIVDPARNEKLVKALQAQGVTSFGLDCVPRISRAQAFDVLSSMSNISGYKSVILAAENLPQLFSGQITAAGRSNPSKVMIIGGGVAGLAALGTARSMGAIARVFDTRPAVKEQVESLGGEFLELPGFELESGAGGYAKTMSQEFIDAEMAMFAKQCKVSYIWTWWLLKSLSGGRGYLSISI